MSPRVFYDDLAAAVEAYETAQTAAQHDPFNPLRLQEYNGAAHNLARLSIRLLETDTSLPLVITNMGHEILTSVS